MGRERLPAHVRRLPAPRRAARRPLRPPAAVPDRDHALHRRLRRLRARDLAGVPDRGARRPGPRRCDRLGRLAVADDGPLHRAGGAGEGDGHLRLRRRGRRQRRRAPRRRPHRPARLALDLPRQRPDRDRRLPRLAAAAPRRQGRGGGPEARRRRRGDRDRGADARRLRDRERQRSGVDVDADDRAARRGGRALGRLPRDRVPRRRAARAAPPVPAPQRGDREHRRCALGGGDVRVVLPLRALPAARARLQPAPGRTRLPAGEPDHGRLLDRALGEARAPLRPPAPARDGSQRSPPSGSSSSRAPRSTGTSSST